MSRALVPLAPGGVLAGKNVRTGNLFSIAPDDLAVHMQVVGASRSGKSNFLEVIARQHILQADGVRRGLLFLDPHGTTVDSLVRWIAKHNLHRYRTVRILDPSNPEYSLAFNPFRAGTFDRAALSDLLVNATVAVWAGEDVRKTPRVRSSLWELYHALSTLGLTLCEADDFLRHEDPKGLRRHYIERLEELDEAGAAFWADLEAISATRRNEYLEGAASRLRPFLRSPFVRRIFGQTARSIDLAEAMDQGEIILVRLKHGERLSPQAAQLIGTLLLNDVYVSCFRRKNVSLPFYCIVDEAASFLTADVAGILDQSRKFGVSLTLATQHLAHLREAGEHIFRSVTTNTMVKATFRGLDVQDAEFMAALLWRGHFDLQKPKARLIRPQAVGNEKVWLSNESTSETRGHTAGKSWSAGTSTTESTAQTTSRSRSATRSHTDSTSQTDSWSRAHGTSSSVASIDTSSQGEGTSTSSTVLPDTGTFFSPATVIATSDGESMSTSHSSGTVVAAGSSVTYTAGGATATGSADSRSRTLTTGTASTKGTATTETSAAGGSRTDSLNHGTGHGRGESYVTTYANQPSEIWTLPELVHLKSVSLANVPVGVMHLRVGSGAPRRLYVPYVGGEYVLPERLERTYRTLMEETPFVAPAAQVDAEYAEHRQKLMEAARPPEPDDAEGEVPPAVTADPARHAAAANKQQIKKREWK